MRIDVAKEVAACVRGLGGQVLDEVLHQPNFANADFWFPAERVAIELKCLTENLASKADFNESLEQMYATWVRRGLVPCSTGDRASLNLREIPLRCAREFIEPIKKRLEVSTIKKANRQLRETKRHFEAQDAKGLLLLVNDGNYMLPPTMMAHLLSRILKGQYSNINSVIYFAVNEVSTAPGIPMPTLFWIEAIPPDREPVNDDFLMSLRKAWMQHHSRLVPDPIYEFAGSSDPAFFDNIQFSRRAD